MSYETKRKGFAIFIICGGCEAEQELDDVRTDRPTAKEWEINRNRAKALGWLAIRGDGESSLHLCPKCVQRIQNKPTT